MPPTNTGYRISLQSGALPCNTSDVITLNVTLLSDDVTEDEPYDHVGAMKFIVATVLVYSLLGILGMLILRIRRRALKSHSTAREHVQTYVKQSELLKEEGERLTLMIETKRLTEQFALLERQTSTATGGETPSSPSSESAFLLNTPTVSESARPVSLHIGSNSPQLASSSGLRTPDLFPLPEEHHDVISLDREMTSGNVLNLSENTGSSEASSYRDVHRVQISATATAMPETINDTTNNNNANKASAAIVSSSNDTDNETTKVTQ